MSNRMPTINTMMTVDYTGSRILVTVVAEEIRLPAVSFHYRRGYSHLLTDHAVFVDVQHHGTLANNLGAIGRVTIHLPELLMRIFAEILVEDVF